MVKLSFFVLHIVYVSFTYQIQNLKTDQIWISLNSIQWILYIILDKVYKIAIIYCSIWVFNWSLTFLNAKFFILLILWKYKCNLLLCIMTPKRKAVVHNFLAKKMFKCCWIIYFLHPFLCFFRFTFILYFYIISI